MVEQALRKRWVVGSIPTTGFRFQVSGNRSRIEGRFNSVFSRVAHEVNDLVRAIGRPSGVIDDMFNGADTAQGDGDEIVELDPRAIGDLEDVGVDDARVDFEEAVGPQPPTLVGPDVLGYFVGGEAVDAVVRPGGLIRRIVRHLILEHDRGAILAVPDDLVLLVVLDKQAVRCDVVAVDDHAGIGCVGRPAHSVAVVSPPSPDVVQQDVVAVDHETRSGLAQGRAADAEEHVLDRRRVGRVALMGVLGAHLQQHR